MEALTIRAWVAAQVAVQKVCPRSPGAEADAATRQITGNVLWGVLIAFGVAILIGIGAIVVGRVLNMPHASKGGIITLIVVFIAGIALLVVPGMFNGIIGSGCVDL
jgi:hypothetical protein